MKKNCSKIILFCFLLSMFFGLLVVSANAEEKTEPDYKELFLSQKIETMVLRQKLLGAENLIISGEIKKTKEELKLYKESKKTKQEIKKGEKE